MPRRRPLRPPLEATMPVNQECTVHTRAAIATSPHTGMRTVA